MFQQHIHVITEIHLSKEDKRLWEKDKNLSEIFTEDFSSDDERTLVMEDSKKYFDKIQEGLNLFSKYFNDLWD